MIDKDASARGGRALTPAKLKALEAARAKRAIAAERVAPEGWRSVDHLLFDTGQFVGSSLGRQQDLANYLGVGSRSVKRWLSGEKRPLQDTINAIAQWRRNKAAGL